MLGTQGHDNEPKEFFFSPGNYSLTGRRKTLKQIS